MFSQPGVARNTRCAAKRIPFTAANPVFVRLRRPNGVNLHLTVASRQMNVPPARSGPRHLAASRKGIPHRSAPRGAKPVFSRLRRPNGVNFNGPAHLLFHQSSASPEWPETLTAPRKEISSPQRTPGSEASVFPPPAAKRHELQWNSSSAVPSKFSQPGVARDTHSAPKRNLLTVAHPRGAKRTRYPGTGNPSLGFPAEKQSTGLFLLPS